MSSTASVPTPAWCATGSAARSRSSVFTDGSEDLRETVDVEGSLAVAECSAAIAARLLGLDT